jgi:hypothetical protein
VLPTSPQWDAGEGRVSFVIYVKNRPEQNKQQALLFLIFYGVSTTFTFLENVTQNSI